MKTRVFWVLTPCLLVYRRFRRACRLTLHRVSVTHVGKFSPFHTTWHPSRPLLSSLSSFTVGIQERNAVFVVLGQSWTARSYLRNSTILGNSHFYYCVHKTFSWKRFLSHFKRSRYSDSLRAGRSGDRILGGREIFRAPPDRPWTPPSLP